MSEAPKLKRCPFCGGNSVYTRMNASYIKDATWSVTCVHGHASSPEMKTKTDAAEWWNRRPKRTSSN